MRTAQGWVENGALDSWKTPGGHRRVRRSAVLAMLDRVKPSCAAQSTIVIVLAARERLPQYAAALQAVEECVAEFHEDPYGALLATGTSLPALIVIELSVDDTERFAMLRRIAVDPMLGHTRVLAISNLPRQTIVEQGGLDGRLSQLCPSLANNTLPALMSECVTPSSWA